jgi:hypothetical protein
MDVQHDCRQLMIKTNKENHCARNASFKNWKSPLARSAPFLQVGIRVAAQIAPSNGWK